MPDSIPARILILEDDPGIAQLERRRLERSGHTIEVAHTAEDARRVLAGGGIELMVLDYRLSGAINGLEFYGQLKDEGLQVPSILVTGFAAEAMLADAIRAGIRDFLPKRNAEFLDFLVPSVERVLTQLKVERELEAERAKVFQEQTARIQAETEKRAMAEEDRRKDEFLAMLAHELRNPLSAISSAIRLSKTFPSAEDLAWSNDVITRQVGHLSHLIDDLLDVSRIRLGKIQLRKQVLDFSEIVPRAVESVSPMIKRKHHTLTVSLEPGPLRVDADPTRLEQILINLLTNAAKYTDDGGVIGLTVSREDQQIVIRVSDSGIGLSAEMIPHIFDLFIQAEGSLDRSQGGLGIGLTLVKTLIAMHGGTIRVESEGLGRGSVFTATLPQTLRSPSDKGTPQTAETQGQGQRILVVDDNEDSARGLARFLRATGHEVEVCIDGPTALELVERFSPDVVLLDIGLPGMNGYEIASALRSRGFTKTKILAVSGYGQPEDRRKSQEAGFDSHLVKPIDHDALLALIAN